jgi:transposase
MRSGVVGITPSLIQVDRLESLYGYFSKNRCVTLRKLKVELDENHGIKLTKYKLWKTLHELGFRTKKSSGFYWNISMNRKEHHV